MIRQLPTFKGYTVDARLKEFRKIDPLWGMEFIPFNSPKGERLLNALIKAVNIDTEEGRELLAVMW